MGENSENEEGNRNNSGGGNSSNRKGVDSENSDDDDDTLENANVNSKQRILKKTHIDNLLKTLVSSSSSSRGNDFLLDFSNQDYDQRINNINAKKHLVHEILALSKTKKSYTDSQFKMFNALIYLIQGEENIKYIFGPIHSMITFLKFNLINNNIIITNSSNDSKSKNGNNNNTRNSAKDEKINSLWVEAW